MTTEIYTPAPTLEKFLLDDAKVRFVIGPIGSGKTTAMIMENLRRAAAQAPSPDGIRRTRVAIVRNTLKQLMSTVLPDIMSVLGSLGGIARFHVTTSCIRVRVGDIHSDWYLMPLETVHDTRRLLSMQLTWAWIAEFREVNYDILQHLLGRCGRFPSVKHGKILPSWWGVFGESNPFNIDSPWNLHLIESRPSGWSFYRQPGGRTPEAEHRGLVPGYYENLVDGADPQWVLVHVDAEIGESLEGRGVWRGLFDRGFHVAARTIAPIPGVPLIFSFDFGRTPACLLAQLDARGRIVIIHEWTSEDMGLDAFVDLKIKPWMNMQQLWGWPRVVTADPSGAHEAQATDLSCYDVLKARGFPVRPAETNELWPRLYSVEKRLLMRMGLLISPHCGVLVRALAGEYRFRKKKTGTYEDTPEKSHPISDVADCLQYLAMLIDGRGWPRALQGLQPKRARSAGLAAWV